MSTAISPDDHPLQDALAFVLRADPGLRRTDRPPVLEVTQLWGQLVLDTRQFDPAVREVAIGETTGWRWTLLGVDMGLVPAAARHVLPYLAPLWSEVRQERTSAFYTPSSYLPDDAEHVLFRSHDSGPVASIPDDWDAFVDIGDRRYTLDELVAEGLASRADGGTHVPVGVDTRLVAGRDGIVFFAHQAHPVPRLPLRGGGEADGTFRALLGLGAFLFAMVLLLLTFAGPTRDSDRVVTDDALVELLLTVPPLLAKAPPAANPDAGEGRKAKDPEGKAGDKDRRDKETKGDPRRVKDLTDDRDVAEHAGVLSGPLDDNLASIFGTTGIPAEMRAGIGGLIGSAGVPFGSGGLGSRNGGLGGGGPAEGVGGLGTKGIGGGKRGHGAEGGDIGPKGEGGLASVGGDPIILGALDRSLIDEVIKRHMSQIRYCYQRELPRSPTLAGKVIMDFTIGRDGSVSTTRARGTLGNVAVENCLVDRFRRMTFPAPRGGGVVVVRYPILFSPG